MADKLLCSTISRFHRRTLELAVLATKAGTRNTHTHTHTHTHRRTHAHAQTHLCMRTRSAYCNQTTNHLLQPPTHPNAAADTTECNQLPIYTPCCRPTHPLAITASAYLHTYTLCIYTVSPHLRLYSGRMLGIWRAFVHTAIRVRIGIGISVQSHAHPRMSLHLCTSSLMVFMAALSPPPPHCCYRVQITCR